jgi:circadian clock protein KaiB
MGPLKARTSRIRLRLYIAGHAPNSVRAMANIEAICAAEFALVHELEIVDVFHHPQRALEDGIIVTPTLIKLMPLPVARVIGDLSDRSQVLSTLAAK